MTRWTLRAGHAEATPLSGLAGNISPTWRVPRATHAIARAGLTDRMQQCLARLLESRPVILAVRYGTLFLVGEPIGAPVLYREGVPPLRPLSPLKCQSRTNL